LIKPVEFVSPNPSDYQYGILVFTFGNGSGYYVILLNILQNMLFELMQYVLWGVNSSVLTYLARNGEYCLWILQWIILNNNLLGLLIQIYYSFK
jgi:hypothetical protein